MAVFFGFHMPNFTFPGVPADKLFDRRRIRAGAIQRWSAARMADDYLEQYRRAQAEPFVAPADAAAAEG